MVIALKSLSSLALTSSRRSFFVTLSAAKDLLSGSTEQILRRFAPQDDNDENDDNDDDDDHESALAENTMGDADEHVLDLSRPEVAVEAPERTLAAQRRVGFV